MNNRAFYNAAGVRAEDLPFSPRSEKLFERLRPIFDNLIFRGCRTLEIGCGNGRISFAIEKSGACACGIDFADKLVEFANRFAQNTGSDAEFFTADAVNFSLRKRFDLIFFGAEQYSRIFSDGFFFHAAMRICAFDEKRQFFDRTLRKRRTRAAKRSARRPRQRRIRLLYVRVDARPPGRRVKKAI